MKLPVIKGVAASIAYLFAHFLEILKGLWLPVLVMTGVTFYLTPHVLDFALQIQKMGPHPEPGAVFAAMGPSLKWRGLLLLSQAILYPMIFASVLRPLVRGEKSTLPFYFQYGADEVRLLLTIILLVVMLWILEIVAGLGGLALMAALTAIFHKIGAVIGGVAMLAIVIALIWFVLRMSVVLPATIGARRIGLAESWRVTKGNAWRLFFYWFLWAFVLVVIGLVFAALIMPGLFPLLSETIKSAHAHPSTAGRDVEAKIMEFVAGKMSFSNPGFWFFAVASYISSIVQLACISVAGGVAYRLLTDGE